MKKTIFFCLLILCMVFAVGAREFTVESFEADPSDLTARTNAVNDLNGNKCALIRVALPNDGGKFEGNVLKQEFYINEYRVYVSKGTKYLQILYPGMETLKIDLSQYLDGQGVESGMTYRLKLSGYEDPSTNNTVPRNTVQGNYLMLDITPKTGVRVEIDGQMQNVENGKLTTFLDFGSHELSVKANDFAPYTETIQIGPEGKVIRNITLQSTRNYLDLTVNPSTGVLVEIDGQTQDVRNGKVSALLPFGDHEVSVAASGFLSHSETVTIGPGGRVSRSINLESIQAHLVIKSATPGVSIKLNGNEKGIGSYSGDLTPGKYIVEVEKTGYRPYTETIELARKEKRIIDIPALEPIYANLDVAYEPYGATITIDGKTVGTTPEVVRDILVGPHSVSITMEGYEPYSGTVNLQEDQPARLVGLLKKKDRDNIFHGVQQPPEFPGGQTALNKWFSDNIRYPESAVQVGLEGTVVVEFVIEKDGSISNVKVLKGVDKDLDAEAIRVIKRMPKWKPKKENGIAVSSEFTLPVFFKLKKEKDKRGKKDKNKYHTAVDLGLSVKWASCNVGAKKPSDYGKYYAWGEIKTKFKYTVENCKTYCKIMRNIEGSQYDIAHTEWGDSWRMPTESEFQELKDKCKWQWTTLDGHAGYMITGPNDNYIFLPAAGYRLGGSASMVQLKGYYWSSTPNKDDRDAYLLNFSDGFQGIGWFNRCCGQSVRPVLD